MGDINYYRVQIAGHKKEEKGQLKMFRNAEQRQRMWKVQSWSNSNVFFRTCTLEGCAKNGGTLMSIHRDILAMPEGDEKKKRIEDTKKYMEMRSKECPSFHVHEKKCAFCKKECDFSCIFCKMFFLVGCAFCEGHFIEVNKAYTGPLESLPEKAVELSAIHDGYVHLRNCCEDSDTCPYCKRGRDVCSDYGRCPDMLENAKKFFLPSNGFQIMTNKMRTGGVLCIFCGYECGRKCREAKMFFPISCRNRGCNGHAIYPHRDYNGSEEELIDAAKAIEQRTEGRIHIVEHCNFLSKACQFCKGKYEHDLGCCPEYRSKGPKKFVCQGCKDEKPIKHEWVDCPGNRSVNKRWENWDDLPCFSILSSSKNGSGHGYQESCSAHESVGYCSSDQEIDMGSANFPPFQRHAH